MDARAQASWRHGGADDRVRTRMLRHTGAPALELMEAETEGAVAGAPILFIHGAFGGAWMWRETFLPYFARRGRAAVALSLRGHGASEGRAKLSEIRLQDYCTDLRRVLADFKDPPIVVAHSLGGLLAQLLIGREEMRALVLLASVPPEGLMLESPRLALTDTRIWLEAFLGSLAVSRPPIAMAGQELLFSEGLPQEQVARHAARMTPEAPHALADAHLPQPVRSASLFRLPTLVMSGNRDRLVSYASGWRTALYHGAQHRTIEGAGHFPQLDVGAEAVARDVLDWINELGA